MNIIELEAEGLKLFEGPVYPDHRGYFMELFKQSTHATHLPGVSFVQDNLSWSEKGVIRGMHLQVAPHRQGKFVRCLSGEIYDVVVDVRKGSKTFKQWFGVELSGAKNHALWVPPGFLHGFQAIEDSLVVYKCSSEFAPKAERGVRFDDHELQIQWPLVNGRKFSDKDKDLPSLKDFNFDEF